MSSETKCKALCCVLNHGQVGWQDCITRLLVKRPISTAKLQQSGSLPDLMTFDEENLELEDALYSPSSMLRLSAQVTDAALVLENEIKGNKVFTTGIQG
jgi:hypothetical protein